MQKTRAVREKRGLNAPEHPSAGQPLSRSAGPRGCLFLAFTPRRLSVCPSVDLWENRGAGARGQGFSVLRPL